MPNKIIKRNTVEEIHDKPQTELRRLNAVLEHEDISEDELKHYGVVGMHWGVRNGSAAAFQLRKSSPLGKVISTAKKAKEIYDKPDKDFAEAAKGMNKAKAAGIYMALGPHWGAKAINSAKAKAADPKEIVKKETKALRKSIANEWAKKSDAEFAAHDSEFRAKYGKMSLKNLLTKSGRKQEEDRAQLYSDLLTKRMEKSLNDIATKHLAGTSYKITTVKGFNDFLPEFEITPNTIEHSDLEHSAKSWKFITERDSDGFVKSMKFPEEFFEVTDEELSFMDLPDDEDELKHYGVIGQKWGIRKDPADVSVKKSRASLVKNRRLISDEELKKTVDRLQMEKKLKELASEDLAPGRTAINSQLTKIMGGTLAAAAGVAGAALVKSALAKAAARAVTGVG